MDVKAEFIVGSNSLCVVKGLSVTLLRPEKVIDIWRWLFKGQIRQAFIKPAMSCNFHFVGLAVVPQEVPGRHRGAGKKDAFLGH